MNNQLFDGVDEFLLRERTFLKKGGMFKNEVQQLMALKLLKKYSLKNLIRKIFMSNLYKYRDFSDLLSLIKREISPLITETFSSSNINATKSELNSIYKDPENSNLKESMEAMLLSYMFLFLSESSGSIGAGDLATAGFINDLSKTKTNKNYLENHALMTKFFNSMTNGSVPLSIFELPMFFINPDKTDQKTLQIVPNKGYMGNIANIRDLIANQNISDKSLINYHFLWAAYNKKQNNWTIFCDHQIANCSDPFNFVLFLNTNSYKLSVGIIRKYADRGILYEGNFTAPPCLDQNLKDTMNIGPLCKLITDVSKTRLSFLKLMKYTKQNPIIYEPTEEYESVFSNINTTLKTEGFTLAKKEVGRSV